MTAPHDLATRLALLKVLAQQIKTARQALDAEAGQVMTPGDRITARLDGQKIAAVTMAEGATTATVTNEAALTAWVEHNHPAETATTVRPAYRKRLLEECQANGEPVNADGQPIPGVAVTTSDPHPTVRPTPEAADQVAARARAGRLPTLDTLLALETGQEGNP